MAFPCINTCLFTPRSTTPTFFVRPNLIYANLCTCTPDQCLPSRGHSLQILEAMALRPSPLLPSHPLLTRWLHIMISAPRQTAHYFLPARIGGSSYQTVTVRYQLHSHPARWLILGAGPLQGPPRPVIELPISPFRTTQRNPTHAAADCRPTPSKLAICFCALPTCPTGCRLHSPSHLNTEEKGKKRRKEIEIRRGNWLGWKVSRPYRTTYKYREDNSRSGTR